MNIFQLIDKVTLHGREFFAYLRLREAVSKADEAYRRTGKRHSVMPSFGGDRKLLVMDRSNFRILKRKGYITHKALVHDMMLESFYFTPHRDGSGWLTDKDRRRKVRQYFSWYAAEIKAAKERKQAAKKRKSSAKPLSSLSRKNEEKKNGTVQCKK